MARAFSEDGRCQISKENNEWAPREARKRGRPKIRWLGDVEEDFRSLGVKTWRRITLVREEWERVIEEAKVLRGPNS